MEVWKAVLVSLSLVILTGRCEAATSCNGGDECCSSSQPCSLGDGDCDSHDECEGSLRCGENNCPAPGSGFEWNGGDDCCSDTIKCQGEDSGCCTSTKRCGKDEGDCDYDSDCQAGLWCGTDNCPSTPYLSWDAYDDCCTDIMPVEDDDWDDNDDDDGGWGKKKKKKSSWKKTAKKAYSKSKKG